MVVVLDSAFLADGGRGAGTVADKLLVGRHLDKVKNRIVFGGQSASRDSAFQRLGSG